MARSIYDAPKAKGRGAILYGVLGLAAVVLIGGVLAMLAQQRTAASERWVAQGPECPVWDQPLPTSKSRADLLTFEYGGATLGRWFGHVRCAELYKSPIPGGGVYHACHFTGPDFVRVTVGGEETTYRPGAGQPAIVTIRDGEALCGLDPRKVAPREP